ncbi:hypothetical protein [Pseudoalteromonas mariniglutinosa]|uniref:nuclear transport factor 2 family protein n=1 Tax=Pseudoalteromonas mariniglutinosa TaxID=206042 RepID=UPI00384F62E5
MKPLLFIVSFLLVSQPSIAIQLDAEVETKTSASASKSVADQSGLALLISQPEQGATNKQQVTKKASQPQMPQSDDSKVLGTETPEPVQKPATKQAKNAAVAEAEQAVNQAKQALTAKQQQRAKQSRESLAVIEQLIKAYNARNIEAFVGLYDENVEFYTFPNQLMFKGKEKLIARYGIMFKKLKCIQSSPIKRIVLGNIVIDHELSETCSHDANVIDKRSELVTSYQVDNAKITKVLFFR